MRNVDSSMGESAKFYVESFSALEDFLSSLTPEESERLRLSQEALTSIHLVLAHHDRFALFRERLPQSGYTDEQKALVVQGIIHDNIDAVITCGDMVNRIARQAA